MVLRDGLVVKDTPVAGVSVRDIASWMVGRSLSATSGGPPRRAEFGPEILSVEHLWVDMPGETVRDMNFSVRKGEILGIGGLAGQGKLGIPNGIMGLFPGGGKVTLHGKDVPLNEPRKRPRDGHGLRFRGSPRRGPPPGREPQVEHRLYRHADPGQVPATDTGQALQSIRDESAMKKLTDEYMSMLDIKCTSPPQKAKELSGGNQQKICLAKALRRAGPTSCSYRNRPAASTSARRSSCWIRCTATTGSTA